MATVALSLFLVALPCAAQAQPRPTIPDLVNYFDLVVFGGKPLQGKMAPLLHKWGNDKISYAIRGQKRSAAAHRPMLERHVASLRKFTRNTFEYVDTKTPGINIVVWMVRPDRMNQTARGFEMDEHLLERRYNGRCFSLIKSKSKRKLGSAIVVINKSLAEVDIDRCMLKGLARSLGFGHSNPAVTQSIFNNLEQHQKLTFVDAVLIRTLYDPRLLPGIPRQEALRLAREVMEDLTSRARK